MREEPQDKKRAALKAALELISEQGFQGAPMSQIASRAGIGVGTIYRYFANKDDMINALYLDIKTRIAEYTLRNYTRDIPVRDAFIRLLSNVIRYFTENPGELSFMEQYENSPLITAATREEGIRIAAPFEDLFHRARGQNLLKELPFEILGTLLSGAIISLAKLQLSRSQLDDDTLTASIAAIWDLVKK